MTSRTPRQQALRRGAIALAAPVLAAALVAAAPKDQAGSGAPVAHQGSRAASQNPFSPAYHHAYRRGVVPTIGALGKMVGWARQHLGLPSVTSLTNLNYGGAVNGHAVTTGHPKVYLVFFGSQWGNRGLDSRGNRTLTGDHRGEAPYLQEMFKGLGRGGDRWSGVMTQYCQGVARATQTCPASNSHHVAYPWGGALRGVWVDKSTKSPGQATGHRLGVEAVKAAKHFGNTSKKSNRNAQYVILSPHGTHPDGFNTTSGQFCAWHDYNGDATLSGGAVTSHYGTIAFTNMPYAADAGSSCGTHFVRSGAGGRRDGFSIVEGHEYAETITDQNPSGGWTDITGEENADKCAWIDPGSSGGAFVLSLPTGRFAMQTTWSNSAASGSGGCKSSHAIVRNG